MFTLETGDGAGDMPHAIHRHQRNLFAPDRRKGSMRGSAPEIVGS
jgi:hypothetical protein